MDGETPKSMRFLHKLATTIQVMLLHYIFPMSVQSVEVSYFGC